MKKCLNHNWRLLFGVKKRFGKTEDGIKMRTFFDVYLKFGTKMEIMETNESDNLFLLSLDFDAESGRDTK